MVPFIYFFTFIFKKHTAAWITLIFVVMVSGVFMMIAAYVLEQVPDTKDPNFYLGYFVYRLFPPFNMGRSILALSVNKVNANLKETGIAPSIKVILVAG